jgi:hypothetical protein
VATLPGTPLQKGVRALFVNSHGFHGGFEFIDLWRGKFEFSFMRYLPNNQLGTYRVGRFRFGWRGAAL